MPLPLLYPPRAERSSAGDGPGKHRQHLACRSHRQGDGDSGGDALLTNDNQNGGDYAGKSQELRELPLATFRIQPRAINSGVYLIYSGFQITEN